MSRSKIDGGLRYLFKSCISDFDWLPVETGLTSLGVADSNFCFQGQEAWIEYKQTDGWKVEVRPPQVGWHERRNRYGGRTFIAIRRQNSTIKGGCVDDLYIVPGTWVRLLKDEGLRPIAEDPPFLTCGGPGDWDWDRVRDFLLAR